MSAGEAVISTTMHAGSLVIQGWRERLEFLNRGQGWVAKRLAAAMPRVPGTARRPLQDMYDSHVANIDSCAAPL